MAVILQRPVVCDQTTGPVVPMPGEFAATFGTRWVPSDQVVRRQDELRNIHYLKRWKVQEDNSFVWAINPMPGEFAATFGVNWLNSDQVRKQYRITLDISAPFIFVLPLVTPSNFEA